MLRYTSIAVVAAICAAGVHTAAHELERTQVSITFAPDGSFVLDVANDPDWLLLRLESFAGNTGAGLLPPAQRDARLRQLTDVFRDRFVIFIDGAEVRPDTVAYVPPRPRLSSDGLAPLATYRMHGRAAADARSLRWFYGLVVDPYPLTVRRTDGQSHTEWVQGANWNTPLDLTTQFRPPTRLTIAAAYLELGYTHILPKGLDHILFVLGIFLLSLKLKPILMQVTTFTLAHSITLGLTMYGVVSLPGRLVEPLIALSIAYVAIENLMTTELRPWRLALVFSFGLLHGMGFAGVLQDLGLPRSQFLTSLLAFNVGVELGQLTVIAIAFACVVGFRGRPWYHRRIVIPASLAIAATGVYWTITRIMA